MQLHPTVSAARYYPCILWGLEIGALYKQKAWNLSLQCEVHVVNAVRGEHFYLQCSDSIIVKASFQSSQLSLPKSTGLELRPVF